MRPGAAGHPDHHPVTHLSLLLAASYCCQGNRQATCRLSPLRPTRASPAAAELPKDLIGSAVGRSGPGTDDQHNTGPSPATGTACHRHNPAACALLPGASWPALDVPPAQNLAAAAKQIGWSSRVGHLTAEYALRS